MLNIFIFVVTASITLLSVPLAMAEDDVPSLHNYKSSAIVRDIQNFNVATPEYNLYILSGKEADFNNPAERLTLLSTKEFSGTSDFFALRHLLRNEHLNYFYRKSLCRNQYRVNDDENWTLNVTFQKNESNYKWQIKEVIQIKNGKHSKVQSAINENIFQITLNADSGCNFPEFQSLGLKIKGLDSGIISDSIDKLSPLDGQQAIFDNLVFFRSDASNQKRKIQTAVASIVFEYTTANPKEERLQNGWLISGFHFLDDDKEQFDLDKVDDGSNIIIPPTDMNIFRENGVPNNRGIIKGLKSKNK